MASKTEYQLMLKLGASTSPSWKTTLGKADAALSQLNTISNKVMAGIAAGVTAAGVTATMAISSAVETFAGFESELATVQSISGATAGQFSELKDAALEAGRSTVFTAEESAAALEYMSLAGWDVGESIAGLQPILKLAAATGKELQTTSDLVTDSMSALGLEVVDLDMYLDKLVRGNNKANNTAEQLMEGLVESGGAARILGVSLDDTITALGKLADNGTKGAEAGTALNAILSRLAGNTTALKELDELNIDLWDKGEFIGFEESLIRINDALSGLTDEDRAMSLKNIAGTHYFSQMEYLLDAVREVADENGNVVSKWQELETQVSDSAGALENMYNTTTDTLLFAQKRLNSAKEDMQIRVTDVFADDAKDFLLWLSEKMPQATDAIVEFAEAHKGKFADALESVGEGIEWLWENGIAAGQWLIKHKGAVVGGLKGVAVGFAGIKAVLAGVKIVELFTNPLSAIPAAAGLALTGIGAVAGAIRDAEAAAVDANLAEHFGDISLSMSEIEDVAQRIVSSKCLTGVLDALEEFDELDTFSDKMDDAVKALEKLNWKVSIGLELTEGEAEEYQRAIADFVENAQEYALQAQYSVSLSLNFAFSEDDLEQSNLVAKVNQFYADKYQDLSDLGTKLNEAVTNAFNDGLLEPDEIDVIARIQADMAEIEKALAVGDYQAELSLLDMEYSGKDLTPETILSLMEELDKKNAEATEAYKAAYGKNYSAITAAYEGGTLTDEEYATGIQALQEEYARETAELQMQSMQFLLNTINSGYADEIGNYQGTTAQVLNDYTSPVFDQNWDPEDTGYILGTVTDQIAMQGDKTTEKALAKLLAPMEDSFDEMYALRGQWDSLTPEMQQTLTEMYADMDLLLGMSGDKKGLFRHVVNTIEDAEGYDRAKEYVDYYYEDITGYAKPEAQAQKKRSMNLTDDLTDDLAYNASEVSRRLIRSAQTDVIQPEIDGMYAYSQDYLDQIFSKGFHTEAEFSLTLHPLFGTLLPSYGSRTPNARNRINDIMSNAAGGIYNKPILTTFAEEGPEAAVPLDGSARAKNIWARAGQILGMLPQGNRDQAILAGVNGERHESPTERSIQILYNPIVEIKGNASKDDVQSAFSVNLEDLREMIAEILREDKRVSFG